MGRMSLCHLYQLFLVTPCFTLCYFFYLVLPYFNWIFVFHVALSFIVFIYLIIHLFSIYVGLNSSSANVSCCTNTDYK